MSLQALADRRDRIDTIDERLTALLLERRRLAEATIAERVGSGGALRDLQRERELLAGLTARAAGPRERSYLRSVFRALLNAGVASATPRTGTVVAVGDARFGGGRCELIAGPCAVEDEAQLEACAQAAAAAGATVLRGGAFKPRTSPRAFQGLGAPALPMLRRAADAHGLALVTEVMEPEAVSLVADYADMLQVGSRNMHCPPLLRAVGRAGKPVLLKRGMSATLEELLAAMDYVRDAGEERVVLCERGIRTVSDSSRFTLDLAAITALKERTDAPVIVDPSHAAGRRALVAPLALAAVGAGADGLMVELHPEPKRALCDGPQALLPEDLLILASAVEALHGALQEDLLTPSAALRLLAL